MAGHSKWANIKHRKERADKKKGKVFSKIAKEIINAVKLGGADPKSNTKLRVVIQKAKAANLPNDIIDRNIKKASSASQSNYSEVTYEIYGHGGVGILVEAMTDNKNRSASEIRIAINKCGGNIATPGSVSYNFDRVGVLQVEKEKADEDELFLLVSENGALDFEALEDMYVITCNPEDLYSLKEAMLTKEVECKEAAIDLLPKTWIECSKEDFEANSKLIDWLENIEDVDSVFHNMKISD